MTNHSGILQGSGAWIRPDSVTLGDAREPFDSTLGSMQQVQPSRKAHAKMLRKYAKLNTFVKCPGCRQKGGMYYLHHPTEEQARWCYYCGYKD